MTEWISVKDKLPKKPGYYLVCWSLPIGPAIDMVYWRGNATWARGNQWITYWMPLPNFPERFPKMIKHCIIFAMTKARAHFIFYNLLEVMLDEGIQIVELKGNSDVVLFSNGEEWHTCVISENCRGRRWDRAFVDSKISFVEIETYVELAKNPHAENYRMLYLPDEKSCHSIFKGGIYR